MNIQGIKNYLRTPVTELLSVRQFRALAYGAVTGTLLLSTGATLYSNKAIKDEVGEVKKETLDLVQNDLSANEYIKMTEDADLVGKQEFFANKAYAAKIQYWDSIKTDYLCKKAYLEGAQMVRDSISNANSKEQAVQP
ncbi:MAG: hypothetical protein NC408_04760 [Candidatus Gastranaerophilales bacterium]|nr:hypothetical protein [Candidatus Gastranaerophilales bacterium]MCM1073211.1 hypothetical protein [Bacteroides sp.]